MTLEGMKWSIHHIVFMVVLTMIVGCTGDGYTPELRGIDTLIDSHPDSALALLDSLRTEKNDWSKARRMRYELLTAKAQNKAFVDFTTDSIAKDFTDYYDRHGSANDRVLAHYLLGCTYRDMGETPRVVNCYMDAIEIADTTAPDFDFYTLSSVYSQLADIYHRQLLLTNEIETRQKASHYAFRANRPYWGVYNLDMSTGAYILLNKMDSAEILLKKAIELYREYGYIQRGLQASTTLLYLYLLQPNKLEEAAKLINRYESESNLYDSHHELPPSKRLFYYYKGLYLEGVNRLDSAELYYRKMYRPDMHITDQDAMYKGLLSVFKKRHQADSIAKYAQLYCEANDSSIALKDQNLTAQVAASYRYNRIQKEAHDNETKAYKTLIALIITFVFLVLLIISAILIWKKRQKKHLQELERIRLAKQQEINRLKTEFADATEEYEENLRQLQLLETTHQKVITAIQTELADAQDENNRFREKYTEAQYTISHINEEYEAEKSRILEENILLKAKIEELQKDEVISQHVVKSEAFAKETIVRRMWQISHEPLTQVTEAEWDQLTSVFCSCYPTLFHDLIQKCNTPQNIRVCILTAIGIGGGEQANMLGTKKQRVSNIKSFLNKALFDESSSRTLRKNLVVHYNIYNFEKPESI